MSVVNPWLLALLAPLAAVLFLAFNRPAVLVGRLPGHWRRLVDPTLHAYMSHRVAGRNDRQLVLCVAIGAALVLALARPVLDAETPADYANFAARAIVIDMDMDADDLAGARLAARRLAGDHPWRSHAIIAAAADSFTAVPLTRDAGFTDRYLKVLDHDVMPVGGRALATGLAHAEGVLRDAGIVNRQIVLLTASPPPDRPIALAASRSDRVVVLTDGNVEHWQDAADVFNADLRSLDTLDAAAVSFEQAVTRRQREQAPGQGIDLGPWLIMASGLAWLWLFRKRSSG